MWGSGGELGVRPQVGWPEECECSVAEGLSMEYDTDKLNNAVLALLVLTLGANGSPFAPGRATTGRL